MTIENFLYTGSSAAWIVPANVSSISVEVFGGGGGNTDGGSGGDVKAIIPVSSGDTLTIVVGGAGSAFSNSGGGGGSSGIYNNTTPLVISGGGGGGGAGSAGGNACISGTAAGEGIVGGGGGGSNGIGGAGGAGGAGAGGSGNGGNGGRGINGSSSGGYGGAGSGGGGNATLGTTCGGGGGGYGGGGGSGNSANGGGAGGSYVIPSSSNISYATSTTYGVAGSNGYITITYTAVIPCFLSNCDILLFSGIYKNITLLDISDEVMGYFSNKPQKIVEIIKNTIEISTLEDTNIPYLIEKSTFGNNCPNKDITISGHHRVVLKTEYGYNCVQAYKLNLKPSTSDIAQALSPTGDIAQALSPTGDISQALSPTGDIVVEYFHVKLQNQDEALIVNNLPLESYREN